MLIKLVISVIFFYFLYKIVNAVKRSGIEKNKNCQFKSSPFAGEDLVEDPVCHTYVPVSQAYKKEISGNDYYFCSKQCSEKYTLEKNN
ncbi:MAG: YHS domain-containing protein [Smithella sp.]|jgi:YHS domain-containing protein